MFCLTLVTCFISIGVWEMWKRKYTKPILLSPEVSYWDLVFFFLLLNKSAVGTNKQAVLKAADNILSSCFPDIGPGNINGILPLAPSLSPGTLSFSSTAGRRWGGEAGREQEDHIQLWLICPKTLLGAKKWQIINGTNKTQRSPFFLFISYPTSYPWQCNESLWRKIRKKEK